VTPPPPGLDEAPTAPATRRSGARPRTLHRALGLVAVIALFGEMRALWGATASAAPRSGVAVVLAFGAALLLGVLTATVPTRRLMTLVDAGVLGVAVLEFAVRVRITLLPGRVTLPTDVGMLVQAGAQALVDGQHLYGVSHPDALSRYSVGDPMAIPTTTVDGTVVSDYGYPPLAAVLAAGLLRLTPTLPTPVVVTAVGVVVAAVLVFVLLPAPLRPAAALTCLLVGRIGDTYGVAGYPALVALPFLVVAVAGWPATGASGRLRGRGLAAACCLGLAAATHQLAWFVVPFLVVGVWLVRRGHLPARSANRVVVTYLGVAALAFVAVNGFFVAQDPRAWLTGITEPLTQRSLPLGQGPVSLMSFVSTGSGAVDWFNRASLVMLLGLLLAFALYVRELGPAAAILPWCGFYLAGRSHDAYFVLLAPLWVVGMATLGDPRLLRDAYRIPLASRSARGSSRARPALAALLPLVALAGLGVALLTPPPLRVSAVSVRLDAGGAPWQADAWVVNRSDRAVEPRFAVTADAEQIGLHWWVVSGPATLGPGRAARYTLLNPEPPARPRPTTRLYLRVVTDAPLTQTVAAVPREGSTADDLRTALVGPLQDRRLRAGQTYRFVVQLRDARAREVRRAGVPVRLTAVHAGSLTPVDGELLVAGATMVDGRMTFTTDALGRVAVAVTAPRPLTAPVILRTDPPRSTSAVVLLWR